MHSFFYIIHSLTCILPGLQTCFYVPKFCWEGAKGHVIRKCPPPRHEFCYHRFRGLYRNSGPLNITLLSQNGIDVWLKVRFALSSSSVFLRTDTTTDSEMFYHSLLDLLEDPEECQEVDELLTWWNRYAVTSFTIMLPRLTLCRNLLSQVFPTSSAARRPISSNSALSNIRRKRLALKQATNLNSP